MLWRKQYYFSNRASRISLLFLRNPGSGITGKFVLKKFLQFLKIPFLLPFVEQSYRGSQQSKE